MDAVTWRESVLTWCRRAVASRGRHGAVAPRTSTPRVPADYLSLHTYLDRRYASIVVLTFEQVEALLGRALPDAARTQRDWWTATTSSPDRHSDAWMIASRTATPNLMAQTVVFERLP